MKNQLILLITILIAGLYACQNNKLAGDSSASQLLKDTVIDVDGNVYHTVKIGKQTWLVENLKVTHYRNCDSIPFVQNSLQWTNYLSGAYCNYNNNLKNATINGCLYNWYAITDNRNLCPNGWHIPNKNEWKILIDYIIGHELPFAVTDTSGWKNGHGFFSVAGGKRFPNGNFKNNKQANYWTITAGNKDKILIIEDEKGCIMLNEESKVAGLSVRCIKDS